MRRTAFAAVLAAGVALTACAGGAASSGGPSDGPRASAPRASAPRAEVHPRLRQATAYLTREDVLDTNARTAYEVVRQKRPRWMRARGAGTAPTEDVIVVYVDDVRMGTPEVLNAVSVDNVQAILYFDGPSAVQRFGSDHRGGAIQVLTAIPQ